MDRAHHSKAPPLFSSVLESCVRFHFYRDLASTSVGRAFGFLGLLALLAAGSFTCYFHQILYPRLLQAADHVPPMMIRNGKAAIESDEASPPRQTLYADPEKILRVELDLETAEEKEIPDGDSEYTIVIGRYSVQIRRPTGAEHALDYPYGYNLHIRRHSLRATLESWQWLILLAVFLISLGGFWVAKVLQACVLWVPGLVLWALLRRDLTYGRLFVLCAHVLSPATLFSMLLLWMNALFVLPPVLISYQFVIYMVIAAEYLLGAILVWPSQQPTPRQHTAVPNERLV